MIRNVFKTIIDFIFVFSTSAFHPCFYLVMSCNDSQDISNALMSKGCSYFFIVLITKVEVCKCQCILRNVFTWACDRAHEMCSCLSC